MRLEHALKMVIHGARNLIPLYSKEMEAICGISETTPSEKYEARQKRLSREIVAAVERVLEDFKP